MSRYASLLLGAAAMAWFCDTKTDISTFETWLLIGGSTTFFWVGGLLDGFLLLYRQSGGEQSLRYLSATKWGMLAFSLLAAVAFFLVGWLGYSGLHLGLLGGFAFVHCMETFSQLYPYTYVATQRGNRLLNYSWIFGLGYVVCLGLPAFLGWGLEGTVSLLCLLVIGKFLYGAEDITHRNPGLEQRHGQENLALFKISGPLVLAALLSQSAVYVDGYLVQRFFPDAFVDFRYGAKEFPLVLLLANSMSIVRGGEIAQGLKDGSPESSLLGLKAGTSRLVWTMFPLSILFLIISGPVFDIAFQARFPQAMPVFDIFLLLAIPRLMFPQSVVRGYNKTLAMSVSAGIELILNVVLSLVLMQFYGIAGIAMATVIAFFAEKAILLAYTQFKLGVSWHSYAPVPLWAGWSLALVGAWMIKYLVWLA